ncbi:MAG: hypothetical protein OXR67_03230 [Chloroflexota bacterium]|nr:hypothetical protein [Chloroflexota bacterium]
MYRSILRLSIIVVVVIALVAVANFPEKGAGAAEASQIYGGLPGKSMVLNPAMRVASQSSDLAFPSDSAGFSTYYRLEDNGSYSLDKSAADDHIFSPVEPEDTTLRTAPATLVDVGANYTVATLTLENIDGLVSTVNLYYDDEGWIVAYLSSGVSSALVWQAKDIDVENPEVEQIGDTILLEAINVVVDEALGETAIESDDTDLGHYHWQYPDADNFLMMAVSRQDQGEYPVQFAVPESLTLSEISSSLWVSQGTNSQAPCAKVTMDDSDLIAQQCSKGIYNAVVDLSNLADTTAHTWNLIQSERDEGASGALMVIIYASSS